MVDSCCPDLFSCSPQKLFLVIQQFRKSLLRVIPSLLWAYSDFYSDSLSLGIMLWLTPMSGVLSIV